MVILSPFKSDIQYIRFMKDGMTLCANCMEYSVMCYISVIHGPFNSPSKLLKRCESVFLLPIFKFESCLSMQFIDVKLY